MNDITTGRNTCYILVVAALASSCASHRSFHRMVMNQDSCEATYFAVQTRLDEAADLFIKEFRRLQRSNQATRELRIDFLINATRHFPRSEADKLFPLFRDGCQDADPEVRNLAMHLLVDYFGKDAIEYLRLFSEHAAPDVRAQILKRIGELTQATPASSAAGS